MQKRELSVKRNSCGSRFRQVGIAGKIQEHFY